MTSDKKFGRYLAGFVGILLCSSFVLFLMWVVLFLTRPIARWFYVG